MEGSVTIKFAKYDLYKYALDADSGTIPYYRKVEGDGRMPVQLRVEPTRANDKYRKFGVYQILSSREVQRTFAFKTGMQGCDPAKNFYSGDWVQGGAKNLVAIAFDDDRKTLYVYVFKNFWKQHKRIRLDYVRKFLKAYCPL